MRDIIKKDYLYGIQYMLEAMDRVGWSMCVSYYWVDLIIVLYIILNNDGGHGTNVCIIAYTQMFKTRYNTEFIHQVSHSPYTTVLDLGVWCDIHAVVEKEHFIKRCNIDALVRSVYETWNNGA